MERQTQGEKRVIKITKVRAKERHTEREKSDTQRKHKTAAKTTHKISTDCQMQQNSIGI